jgi:putative FmdB family regulatory protein
MPIYEFHCPSCGTDFEELVRTSAARGAVPCPKCGSKQADRKISTFAAHSAAAPVAGCPLSAQGMCGQRCEPGGPCGLI